MVIKYILLVLVQMWKASSIELPQQTTPWFLRNITCEGNIYTLYCIVFILVIYIFFICSLYFVCYIVYLYIILYSFYPFHLYSIFVQLIVFGKTLNFQNILCTIWERRLKWFLVACSISICKIPNRERLRNIWIYIWKKCLHIWNIWPPAYRTGTEKRPLDEPAVCKSTFTLSLQD